MCKYFQIYVFSGIFNKKMYLGIFYCKNHPMNTRNRLLYQHYYMQRVCMHLPNVKVEKNEMTKGTFGPKCFFFS